MLKASSRALSASSNTFSVLALNTIVDNLQLSSSFLNTVTLLLEISSTEISSANPISYATGAPNLTIKVAPSILATLLN